MNSRALFASLLVLVFVGAPETMVTLKQASEYAPETSLKSNTNNLLRWSAGAVVVFLSLAGIGAYTVFVHMALSGAEKSINDACPVPPIYASPSQLQYTHLTALDAFLCNLVEFFKIALLPPNKAYSVHFLAGVAPVALVFLIEGTRSDRSRAVIPLIIGLLYQTISGAVAGSLSWLVIVLSVKGGKGRAPLTQAEAESVFMAISIGYVLPTLGFVASHDEYVIAYWQVFPLFMSILQVLWLQIRPATVGPAYYTTRMALITTIIISAAVHISFVLNHSSSTPVMSFIQWWPSFTTPDPRSTTVERAVYHLLQWDSILWYASAILGQAYLAGSIANAMTTLFFAPIGSIILSPGGYVALLAMYREMRLTERAQAEALTAEKKKE